MTGLRRALLLLGLLGASLIAVGVALTLSSSHMDDRGATAAVGTLIMSTYMGVGLFAWWRRPANRVGMLLAATGFAAFLSALTTSDSPLLFTVGLALGNVFLAVAVHMLLAFPSGRVETLVQRRLVVTTYVLAATVPSSYLLFTDDCGCRDPGAHPDNLLMVADAPGAATVVEAVGTLLSMVVIGSISLVLIKRWRAAGPRDRPALSPVLWTGATMVVLLAVLLAVDLAAPSAGVTGVAELASLTAFAALPFAFLAGLVRSRAWRSGAVLELVDSLGSMPGRGRLRDSLAEALADPTLEVAYWLPDRGRFVAPDGRPVEVPGADDRRRAATEVERDGRRVGAIVHDAALCDEPELLRTVAGAAGLALDNERLGAELRARVEELRDSRSRLLETALAERRRLERDLHDGAQQRLVSLSLQLGLAGAKLERDPEGARELLDAAREETRAALEDLRELARGIHPAVLTDRGLAAALDALVDRAPLPVEVAAVPGGRLSTAVEAAVYFVASEALANVAKYAGATHAEIRVTHEHGSALVEIRDDGAGGADPAKGTGLRGLAERLEVLDGRLELESPPGRGTIVRARIPSAPPVGAPPRTMEVSR